MLICFVDRTEIIHEDYGLEVKLQIYIFLIGSRKSEKKAACVRPGIRAKRMVHRDNVLMLHGNFYCIIFDD